MERVAHLEHELRQLRREMRVSSALVPPGDLPLLTFWLDDQRYALYLQSVREVVRMLAPSPLPGAPSMVVGLARMRRAIVALIDLRRVLHLPAHPYHANTPIVLFEYEGQPRGLIVDGVDEVITVPASAVELPQESVPHGEYILRIVRLDDGLILVLDHSCLLEPEDEVRLTFALNNMQQEANAR